MVPNSRARTTFGFRDASPRLLSWLGSALSNALPSVGAFGIFNDFDDLKELVLPISCRGFIAATAAGSEGLRVATSLRATDLTSIWPCSG